jgi:hypothetical protein
MTHDKKSSTLKNNIHQSISGIPYPASKEELIEYASTHGTSGEVIDLLEKLPPIEFQNEPQVLSTLKEYKDV